jgi:dihydroorotate dehydrogenase (NAD+) catalytic subunit
MKINTSAKIGPIDLRNPVLVASGTFGYGDEAADLVQAGKLGGIITKTITLHPKQGNPPPRIAEVTGGMLNSIGLQNVGAEAFVREKLPALRKLDACLIVSIAGETAEEYGAVAEIIGKEKGVAALELNLSCPNLKKKIVCMDEMLVAGIIGKVKAAANLPVIAKLSPHVTDISETAALCKSSGADAVTLVNTFTGMAVDIKTWKPKLANVTGGMSGPALKPLALRCVYEVFKNVDIPILACGGIMTAEDAIEFFLAGACAVSVGTANFTDPLAPIKIAQGIVNYLKSMKLSSLGQIIGRIGECCETDNSGS